MSDSSCKIISRNVPLQVVLNCFPDFPGKVRRNSVFFSKSFLILIFIMAGSVILSAQHRNCGIDHHISWSKLRDFAQKHQDFGKTTADAERLNLRTNHYFHLVFHIVLEKGRPAITLDQIEAQIEVLNEAFNGTNEDRSLVPEDFRPFAANSGIQFCLAYTDDGAGLKPAIQQKTTDQVFFGDMLNQEGKLLIKYSALGGYDQWNSQSYINIWIAELSAFQGFATLPGEGPDIEAGIVIDPDFFGYFPDDPGKQPFNLGKTLVHEMGHYFGLLHPWGLVPDCNSDDGVEDTPVQGAIYYGCPQHPRFSCGSADMFMNFMNFTDDECLVFFTEGQKSRMWEMIWTYYPDLTRDQFCRELEPADSPVDQVWIRYQLFPARLRLDRIKPDQTKIQYHLFDVTGRTVVSGNFYGESVKDIYLNHIAPGIYILFLQDDKKFISWKFVLM